MLSAAQIREIEERNKELEKLNPSKEEQIRRLEEQIREFEESEHELKERKRENSGNLKLVREIDQELDYIRDTRRCIEEEIWDFNWSINHPDPTIDDVFKCLSDTIQKLLPILLRILDYIRRKVSDSSDEITVVDVLMEQTSQYPKEWSKLVGMLFQFPDDDDDDWCPFFPPVRAEKERKKEKAKQYMDDILSQLHTIFFQDEKHPEFLSDFGIFIILAITNHDESDEASDCLISDFLSGSHCDISQIFLEQRFQRIFFKALGHPIIQEHLKNFFIDERKHRSFVSSFPRNVSKIQSFLCEVEADYINMKDFPEIVSSLKEICDILEV